MIYTAVIGDLIKSRTIHDRMQTQRILQTTLDDINIEYADRLASRFMITIGDEFQGLLYNRCDVLKIVDHIERHVYPVRIRFGIGVGDIVTDIQYKMPLGADGPAYHFARAMVDEIKALEHRRMEAQTNVMIQIDGDKQLTEQINICLFLMTVLKNLWTVRRVEVMNIFTQCKSQIKTAEILGITQPSVHQFLADTSYYTYEKALNSLTSLLSEQGETQ